MVSRNALVGINSKLIIGFIRILLLFLTVSCNSFPKQTPQHFVKTFFIEKHISKIDLSTADLYDKEEQPGIRELITQNIHDLPQFIVPPVELLVHK